MKKSNNITCRLFLILGLALLSHPAFAEKAKPKFHAVVCFEPVSGRQIALDSADAACPPDYQYFRLFKLMKVSGLPPHQREKEEEASDAASDRQ